jgi:xylan 1,4-beta-xylosidase
VLATNDIDLPVLNVFRMFSMMSTNRVAATSSNEVSLEQMLKEGVRKQADVAAIATVHDDGRVAILLWHYHDDDVPGPDAAVEVQISGLKPPAVRVTHYQIDENHSNAFAAWKRMGSPVAPNREQYEQLNKAGQLAMVSEPATHDVADDSLKLDITLPRQAVALLMLERD